MFVFDWASYMQIELKTGEYKTPKIIELLNVNEKYYHGCIIYVNSESIADALKKKLDNDTQMNTKVINNVKGAELFWP